MKKIFFFLMLALCWSVQAQADKVAGSTTLPDKGKPEHVYTMVSGNGTYVSPTTTPVEGDAENGLFAFYPVEGVDGAFYIYSHNAKKWLTYEKAANYDSGKGFVKLSNTKVDGTYFRVNNYAEENYEISPYTTSGSAQNIYLNYFQGASANSGMTLGLWTDGGNKDAGSRYTFKEYVIEERTYTISVPEGVTLTIGGVEYANGSTISVEGSFDRSTAVVTVPDGKFAVVSVDDVANTITIYVATLPTQADKAAYQNAWVYPKQQDNVGVAELAVENGVYTLSNNVLAASWIKVGDAIYFAGSKAMNLLAGTEPFTVAFGSGDNVPASAMTLKSVENTTLTADASAVGGAEHFNGVQLVANYEYTYKGKKLEIEWRAVLRDGSHYIRTEMDLKGVDDVDMFNIIPMIYNVDTEAAGSAPKVIGNTRGAVLMSDKIFAGLETPTAYNTVGEASGEVDPWELADTKTASLTASSWEQVASNDIPARLVEAIGVTYPNVRAYQMKGVQLTKNQKVEVLVQYTGGNHRLNFGGADLLASNGDIAASDYHSGFSGGQHSDNTFTFVAPYDGEFAIRVFVEDKTEAIDASSNMTAKIFNAKEGVEVNTAIVGIQGRWSRNTTLAAGETWKAGAVVGLVAQDGKQSDANLRATQKRRSFLAYSERERAVPWRAFPHYNSWYELNIDRNNAAPGSEHTNFTSNDIVDVLRNWKTSYYDKFGEGPVAFVIDDGWDNYGPWTFHSGFPNEMRDMATLAEEMGAGVGAWLGPVGGYGQSGNYRRAYWSGKGGMQLSNPAYYKAFKDAAYNLVKNQGDYKFFKFDGISAQFSATGPDAGDTGNENAEGIIRLERYVREELREDIFFNTTVGTWASPFWYQISDATWRQEGDYGEAGNNNIDREKWITYRDRLVYQNYVTNSPICPINTLMTHGFILTKFGAVSKNMTYDAVLRELRCAFVCGSGMVELYSDYALMNSINNGKLWEDLAECIAWQKKNADVLPDVHWVGGNPWTGSKQEVYGWASWNGSKATLALRNGSNSSQTYKFTLREAFEIPANISGAIVLNKSFKVQDALSGLSEGEAIDIDQPLTVTLPASSVFAFDGVNSDPSQVPFEVVDFSPKKSEVVETIKVTFNADIQKGKADADAPTTTFLALYDEKHETVIAYSDEITIDGSTLTVKLGKKVTTPGVYDFCIPQGVVARAIDNKPYSGWHTITVVAPTPLEVKSVKPDADIYSLSTVELTFNKEVAVVEDATAQVEVQNEAGEQVTTATAVAEGNVLTLTLAKEITTPGEYVVVIPEGVVVGAAIGDAFSGKVQITVEKFDVYKPRHTESKTRADRKVTGVKLKSATFGASEYALSEEQQGLDYVNLVDAEEPVCFVVAPGEEVALTVEASGSWVHFFAFVDQDADGFTASIAEGSQWEPAGDLVAYSFYNNGSDSDERGWNSVGTEITGGDRNKPALPAFKAPEKPGVYRMRVKQDWCNIDPQGDADGKFGDFKDNGGVIVDLLLAVTVGDGIEDVLKENKNKSIYDLTGRKLNKVTTSGVYIINGKKVMVK